MANRGSESSGGVMSDSRFIQPDPSMIGGVSKAPFVKLPDPRDVFARRAQRLRMLTVGGHLASYLEFLASISDAQCAVLPELGEAQLPAPEFIERARRFNMPALDRNASKGDAALHDTCQRLFTALASFSKPEAAEAALARTRHLDVDALDAMITAVLADSIPADSVAEHVYVAAGLQVHFARLAAQMDANALGPVGVGLCPVCGGRPVVSMIVGWHGADGARYASCTLCSTLWNEVRVKCLACGSTKGVGYQEIEGQGGTIKAETCDECGSYVKVLYQHKDTALDPVADDVGSLDLDQLLRESAYARAGLNPYLAGY
jgi:FdhE protein